MKQEFLRQVCAGLPTVLREQRLKEIEHRFSLLLNVNKREVERELTSRYNLAPSSSAPLQILLVPYQAAVEMTLRFLPEDLRLEAQRELQRCHPENASPALSTVGKTSEDFQKPQEYLNASSVAAAHQKHKWIRWVEEDIYVQRQPVREGPPRIPVMAVMGHIDHGKTTLLDRLVGCSICEREPGFLTQSLRCFTFPFPTLESSTKEEQRTPTGEQVRNNRGSLSQEDNIKRNAKCSVLGEKSSTEHCAKKVPVKVANPVPVGYPENITIVDTPGHKIFAEMRLHTHLAVDFILLLVALDEGVRPQTRENIRVALTSGRTILVGLNKMDLFTDRIALVQRVDEVLRQLEGEGLEVRFVPSMEELHALCTLRPQHRNGSEVRGGSASPLSKYTASAVSRRLRTRRAGRGSVANKTAAAAIRGEEALDPCSKRIGDYVQGTRRRVLAVCLSGLCGTNVSLLFETLRAMVRMEPPRADPTAVVQAEVLESSKQAYEAEAHGHKVRQSLSEPQSNHRGGRFGRLLRRRRDDNASTKAIVHAHRVAASPPTYSSSILVLTVLVRSGVLRVGQSFVADQSYGTVTHLCDCLGRSLSAVGPGGMAIVGDRWSRAGCPVVSTHLIGVGNKKRAAAVRDYRQRLSAFVQTFPRRTALLRPEGLDARFRHLGDFGQVAASGSAASCPAAMSSLERRLLYGALGKEGSTSAAGAECGTEGKKSAVQSDGVLEPSRVSMDDGISDIDSAWARLLPHTAATTEAEMERWAATSRQVPVLVKVDSWHAARVMLREVPALSTLHCMLHVVGVRFGALSMADLTAFGQVGLVVCYRVPPIECANVAAHVPSLPLTVVQQDVYATLMRQIKHFVVQAHHRYVQEHGLDRPSAVEAHLRSRQLLEQLGLVWKESTEKEKPS